jgi:DNA repair photolyase
VKRLIRLLMDYGVSFFITTKRDPSFLLELPGFVEHKPKFIATTVEGTPEILRLLSPGAPPFDARVATIRKLSELGVDTVIRFDPLFVHLFQALYGDFWLARIAELMDVFATTGAKHIIASTGRLSKRRSQSANPEATSMWQRVYEAIHKKSPPGSKEVRAGVCLRSKLVG